MSYVWNAAYSWTTDKIKTGYAFTRDKAASLANIGIDSLSDAYTVVSDEQFQASAYDWASWTTRQGTEYIANGFSYAADFFKGASNFFYTATKDSDTVTVLKDMVYTCKTDIVWIVGANMTNLAIQSAITSFYDAYPESTYIGFGLYAISWGASIASFTISTNRTIESIPRVASINTASPKIFKNTASELNINQSLCQKRDDPNCEHNDLLTTFSSVIAYYIVGGILDTCNASALKELHLAHYILQQGMLETCDKHKNMHRLTGLPIVIALTRGGFNYTFAKLIEHFTYLPPQVTLAILELPTTILSIGAVSHMPKNRPVAGEKLVPDLVYAANELATLGVEAQFIGFPKAIKKRLKPSDSEIPWQEIKDKALICYNKPAVQYLVVPIKDLLIPEHYQTIEGLINDPVNKHYWPIVQDIVEHIFNTIHEYERKTATKVVGKIVDFFPKLTADIAKMAFGLPKPITALILYMVRDVDGRILLEKFRLLVAQYSVQETRPKFEQNNEQYGTVEQVKISEIVAKKKNVNTDAEVIQTITGGFGFFKPGAEEDIIAQFSERSANATNSQHDKQTHRPSEDDLLNQFATL